MHFLFEIGLEEVPARMLAAAQQELGRRVADLVQRERLVTGEASLQSFSTPRRLAVLVQDVAARQPDLSEELTGPATKIAFKDGEPTPAAHAFAKKAGVEVSALRKIETPKGEYLAATAVRPGRSAQEVLLAELPKELAAIYWPKNMYWRAGKPERFVRPVRWMVALLDGEIVPVEFAGKTAANLTFGHRVLHGAEPIPIAEPGAYVQALTSAFVQPDVELRRHTIRKALDRVCRTVADTRWREDHALVDKMTHLTEWPSVLAGSFDPSFLTLPEEVLVTVMRDHQNYFAVEDKSGKLAPHFLAVLNTAPTAEAEATIRHGNERVLRARFNDARFFWDFDQRIPLADRVGLLENVTFQKDLGSYAAKSGRVRVLAAALAEHVPIADPSALETAARLAKTDLTAELVKEFTELQGQVGGLYARAQGVPEAAAIAIYDHYQPASMEAAIPRTVEGQLLAIADKADSIAGMFSLGLEPTGSKDPFALRRAANGIVRILAESQLPLTLGQVAFAAAPPFTSAPGKDEPLVDRMELFFAERLDFYLREARSQTYDVVKAVLAASADDPRDAVARAEALTAVRGSEDFAAVSAAFKRTRNILSQAAEKGIAFGSTLVGLKLTSPAEEALLAKTTSLHQLVLERRTARDYIGALEAIATLRPQIDAFFDSVLIMDPDESVRHTRLTILNWLELGFSGIADFSEIVTTG